MVHTSVQPDTHAARWTTIHRVGEIWPGALAVLCLWIAIAQILGESLQENGGHLVYAFDDPYIHMAIAKNFVTHGVWGVTRYDFTSSTSSILWPLLVIAAYVVAGVDDVTPLVLNAILASLLVVVCDRLLYRHKVYPWLRAVALLALVFVTPIPLLVFSGLEHVLQILVDVAYVDLVGQYLASHVSGWRWGSARWLFVLTPLVTAARYEGLAIVTFAACLAILRRQRNAGIAVMLLGLAPVVGFGLIAVANGSFLLPNSVVLKAPGTHSSGLGTIVELATRVVLAITFVPAVYALLLLALGLLVYVRRQSRVFWSTNVVLLLLFCTITVAHACFGLMGPFYRYEAYLVALGVFVIAAVLPSADVGRLWRTSTARCVAVSLALSAAVVAGAVPVLERAVSTYDQTTKAMHDIYRQQYQMARFVGQFYPGGSIVLNDIGLVNYANDVRCFDVFGLANIDVARFRRSGAYNSDVIASLAERNGATIAIVYDRGFREGWITTGGVPANWIRVGRWTIPDSVVVYDPTVSFYALTPSAESELRAHLADFDKTLPPDVVVSGQSTLGSAPLRRALSKTVSGTLN